jgi:hypothetical protein
MRVAVVADGGIYSREEVKSNTRDLWHPSQASYTAEWTR